MAEDVEVIIPDIHAAHADSAGLGVVQAGDELHQTGLCAAGAADDAQCLAGLDVKGDVVQDRLAGAVLVLEGDVVEADAAVLDLLHGSLGGGQVGLLVQDFHDALCGSGGHGDHDESHAQHHQSHQDVHDVAEQSIQLAGGQRAVQDVLCAEPAQGNVAAVNSRQHGGVVEAQTALCVDELLIQTLAGFGVLLILEALADEALDHADSGDVLLHGGVQVVVILENTVENFEGGDHDACQHGQQEGDGHHEDEGQRTADTERHDECEHQMDRGAHTHALHHLEGILQVGHVGGHTGDEAGGGEFVDVGEGVVLDILIHRIAQVAGKAGGRLGGVLAGQNAQQQGDGRHCEGEQAVFDDGVHIALFNAKVDDERHDGGQQDVHECFQCGKHRRQDSGASVFAQMGSKLLYHTLSLL